MLHCPACQSRKIHKDYAPSRGYILALAGMGMLFVRSFVNPVILYPALQIEDNRLLIMGLALFIYGAYCIFHHGNVYCNSCGLRFRRPGAGGEICASLLNFPTGPQNHESAIQTTSHLKAQEKVKITDLKPVLACLKFKDPKQREQALKTLQESTGQNFGDDYQVWSDWLKQQKTGETE